MFSRCRSVTFCPVGTVNLHNDVNCQQQHPSANFSVEQMLLPCEESSDSTDTAETVSSFLLKFSWHACYHNFVSNSEVFLHAGECHSFEKIHFSES